MSASADLRRSLARNQLRGHKLDEYKKLKELVAPHIDSFNYFLEDGVELAVERLDEVVVEDVNGDNVAFWIQDVQIGTPSRDADRRLFPRECREGRVTYGAPMFCHVGRRINGEVLPPVQKRLGTMPIMVGSSQCHLVGKSPAELVALGEEMHEFGGYFIVNGLDKVVRMLIMPRRNSPVALERSAFTKRGSKYTNKATSIRCVAPDESAATNNVHYLSDGTCNLRFSHRRQEFFIPVVIVLKALLNTTDREIYEKVAHDPSHVFHADHAELWLRDVKKMGLFSQAQCLAYIGKHFRVALQTPNALSDVQVGELVLRKYVFVHLSRGVDKFELLVFMLRKLLSLVNEEIQPDNTDSMMNQELLLPGHLFAMVFKDKLGDFLAGMKGQLRRDVRPNSTLRTPADVRDIKYMRRLMDRAPWNIGQKLEYMLSTGNVQSQVGLDLMQVSGYAVVAERLNFLRYLSHFRAVHRGSFFAEMKTTTVRKLLPETWGFLCPVHTPDGSPCGLLNHITRNCSVVVQPVSTATLAAIVTALHALGVSVASPALPAHYVHVLLDGRVVGAIDPADAPALVDQMRYRKVTGMDGVPPTLEVVFLPPTPSGVYPGVYLATTPARMMREVVHLATHKPELVGTMEQVYLNVAVTAPEISDTTSHVEVQPTNMLSVIANLTPFSDFNQSPRNMYQCQMGKQTMGFPVLSLKQRKDNKLYKLQTPQRPMVKTQHYDEYGIDEYPLGTNAVVAVISYTGYDMEDAMILNKASHDRGFAHGTVYQTSLVELDNYRTAGENTDVYFGNRIPGKEGLVCDELDEDGLPHAGTRVAQGSPLYCVINASRGTSRVVRHKYQEPAVVDQVCVIDRKGRRLEMWSLKLRFNRNPIIGDKFSSRHGQKGILSQLWRSEDMPFSESGLVPDIIINPNAFPSRMTIGMIIESICGKAGALHGMAQDATPFRFSEKERAVEYFGEQMRAAGFNYYGNEPMYSGITGDVMEADIFIGVVYYQRLRHMVSDKYQVRAKGPVSELTRQPVKGRKMGGGIRLGEMERDSLLAHGASFLLQDRLLNCSDGHLTHVCRTCGSILSPAATPPSALAASSGGGGGGAAGGKKKNRAQTVRCLTCKSSKGIDVVAVPYVLRYLAAELAAVNVKMTLDVK